MSTFSPQGLTVPSMTTAERNAIVNPEIGRFIYNSTKQKYEVYTGTFWADFDFLAA